jgi:hypothetical protein
MLFKCAANRIIIQTALLNGIMINGIIQLMGSNRLRLKKSEMPINSIYCKRNIFGYHSLNGISYGLTQS